MEQSTRPNLSRPLVGPELAADACAAAKINLSRDDEGTYGSSFNSTEGDGVYNKLV